MDKVTCIVVGAGPAGTACAYALAQKGIETVLLERGTTPGEKNVSSFVLYTSVLKGLIPDFREDLPLERNVVRTETIYLGKKDTKALQSYNWRYVDDPIAFTAFRRKYDAWFARKAVDAGVELISGMKVSDLIVDAGRVVGVRVGEEELYADVVVGADGFHSIVGEKAGLIDTWPPERCLLAVKQVLNLPSEVINERFQLENGLGCEQGINTYQLNALNYFSATLYTNTDSVSLAVFARLNELQQKKIKLHEQMEMLKQHPYIDNFIKGATLREYEAHILPDGGRVKPKDLYGDGVLLCGEAGGITDTVAGMGIPNCMLSGLMAAETIADALRKKDFGRRTMQNYLKYLDTTKLLDMVHQSRRDSDFYAGNGLAGVSDELAATADIYNQYWETSVEYIDKQPFPLWTEMFMRLGQYHIAGWVYWPVTILIKLAGLPGRWAETMKSKMRSRYYGWKKNIVN